MKYTFTAAAIFRMENLVNLWPTDNRGMSKVVNKLANALEIKEAEHEALQWTISPDGQAVNFRFNAPLTRELDEDDVKLLTVVLENPPARFPWTRQEGQLQAAIYEPLGLEPWFSKDK